MPTARVWVGPSPGFRRALPMTSIASLSSGVDAMTGDGSAGTSVGGSGGAAVMYLGVSPAPSPPVAGAAEGRPGRPGRPAGGGAGAAAGAGVAVATAAGAAGAALGAAAKPGGAGGGA